MGFVLPVVYLPSPPLTGYIGAVMADSPSLYWRLNDTSGSTAADASGNSRTGTYGAGMVLQGDGRSAIPSDFSNKSAKATGTSTTSIISSSYNPFTNGTSRTFEGWTWWSGGGTPGLFESNGANLCGLRINGANGDVFFTPNLTTTGYLTGVNSWQGAWPGQHMWVHWALVFNESTDVAELFINGVSKGTKTATATYGTTGTFQAPTRESVLGALNGYTDEIAVYETALTSTRILAHYNAAAYPDSIAGLETWLRAESLSFGGTANGTAVTTWEDSSSANKDASQATAGKKPIYRTNAQNGIPCVEFGGATNTGMDIALTNNDQTRTIFAVAKSFTNSVNRDRIWDGPGSMLTPDTGPWGFSSVPGQFDSIAMIGSGKSRNTMRVLTARMNSLSSIDLYYEQDAAQNFDPADTYADGTNTIFRLGNSSDELHPLRGYIAEIIVYNSALSDTDLNKVRTYLRDKWATNTWNVNISRVSETDTASTITATKAISRPVNQVTETDSATALTRRKLRAVNQITETDTAQTMTRKKTKAIGQPTETNVAQAMARVKRTTLVQASETDSARPITRPVIITVNRVTETDVAQTMIRRKLRAVNQITETDVAQTMTRVKRLSLVQVLETDLARATTPLARVNRIIETDIASAITARKTKALIQISETDIAQTMTRRHTRLVNQISETDSATALTRRKLRAINQIVETDTAQAFARVKTKVLIQVSEQDVARAILWAPKNRLVNRIVEVNIAQPLTARHLRTLVQALETDIAQPITRRKTRLANQIIETDIAQAMTRLKAKTLVQVSEADIARAITWAPKKRFVTQVIETDQARIIVVSGRIQRVTETDIAQPLTKSKLKLINRATETDVAQTMTRRHTRSVGQVIEVDTAQALAHLKRKTLGQVVEVDIAQPFAHPKRKAVNQIIEIDTARPVGKIIYKGVGRVIEIDSAQVITPFLGTLSANKIAMVV